MNTNQISVSCLCRKLNSEPMYYSSIIKAKYNMKQPVAFDKMQFTFVLEKNEAVQFSKGSITKHNISYL